jgi:hypothetical protein
MAPPQCEHHGKYALVGRPNSDGGGPISVLVKVERILWGSFRVCAFARGCLGSQIVIGKRFLASAVLGRRQQRRQSETTGHYEHACLACIARIQMLFYLMFSRSAAATFFL